MELKYGSFCLFDNGKITRVDIKLKEVINLEIKINNALTATDEIISLLENQNLRDKILILRLSGLLEQGKSSDIDFQRIEQEARKKGAYSILKSVTKLHMPEPEIKIDFTDASQLENQLISSFTDKNPSKFNFLIKTLSSGLEIEKLEEEKSAVFEERLMSEIKRIIEK